MARILTLLVFCLCAPLLGCGGGGGDDSSLPPPSLVLQTAGGFWTGTINYADGSNAQVDGLVSESHSGSFLTTRGEYLSIDSLNANNGTITIEFTAYPAPGEFFQGGYQKAAGTFTGTLVERSRFNGDWTLATGEAGRMSVTYTGLYDFDSSLDTLSGMWDTGYGILSIDADGSFFMQDGFGCVIDGSASVIDSAFNAYDISMRISSCEGWDGQYSGLAMLNGSQETPMGDSLVINVDNGEAPVGFSALRQ